jgi:hypothetical protein
MTSDAAIETERAASQKAVADYIRNGHPSNARSAARHAIRMSSMPTKIREANLYYNNRVDRLVSSVCSTVPALSMPAGKAVVPGKLPSQVLPADYLRSQHYTPVARFSANPTALHEKILGHGPTLTRLGAGALGAGAVYGIDHWLKNRKKNRPAYTGEQNG